MRRNSLSNFLLSIVASSLSESGHLSVYKNGGGSSRSAQTTKKIRFFQYRETRSAAFLAERFQNYTGVLLSDGFSSYDALCRELKIPHAACWAHARRKFADIVKLTEGESFAGEVVEEIRKLYAIEARCREQEYPADKIREIRQADSLPIIDRLFELLKSKQHKVPARLPLGEAIQYALGQESKLRVFLENGHVPIDTNTVENAIRPFVIGRKNWLFSGSPRGRRPTVGHTANGRREAAGRVGADSSALIYSLIETAKANGLEPWAYLRYLFEKLPLCQSDDEMRALLPHRAEPTVVG